MGGDELRLRAARQGQLQQVPAVQAQNGPAVGADVPYCILGGTALAEGIGEKLTPLPPIPACRILIAKPDAGVSTKYVYEHLDLTVLNRHPDIDGMTAAIRGGDLAGITGRMENVLETVTIPAHPVIADIKEQMLRLGAENSLMSGSGPTVFGGFRDPESAGTGRFGFRNTGISDCRSIIRSFPACRAVF